MVYDGEYHHLRLMGHARVIITEQGRSGDVIYREFAGGDAIAMVNMGSASEWRHGHPWAVDRRAAILRSVAEEVVRQKAAGCRAEIDEEGGWITIMR
jgi:hypothetical protein